MLGRLNCLDANSKLIDVVTVADVGDEESVGDNLVVILKLKFGQDSRLRFLKPAFLFRL